MTSRRRYVAFAAVTFALASGVCVAGLLAFDLYLHRKYQNNASVNVWGYRGPAVGSKAAGETRVVVLGGSTAFGYGPDYTQSFPYLLERRLQERGRFSVVNLAYTAERAFSFRPTMEDYDYLDFDIAILYEGYNDLADYNTVDVLNDVQYVPYRRRSGVFRLTGYLPIFPIVLREKAYALLYDGDISKGYAGAKPVFRPGLATEVTAGALQAAATTAQTLERHLGKLSRDGDTRAVAATDGCDRRWRHYCGAVEDAIRWARARDKRVIVTTQPYLSDVHVEQQRALIAMLDARFKADAGVRHVNLGRAIDLRDTRFCYDGVHLLAAGNQIVADAFVEPVLALSKRTAR